MKYAIVIPDGAADEPQPDLDGRTPLQAAKMPNADRAVMMGQLALTNNVPQTLTPASDVATLSLFGYDPMACYTGRAPLEAAALGVTLRPNDWAIRCNLVHIEDGRMTDFTAGHIPREESRQLIEALQATLGSSQLQFVSGVSYRNLLIHRGSAPFNAETKTQPPHDIPNQPVADHLPTGPGGDLLRDLMERAAPILAAHPVNLARTYAGKRTANQIWLWGQGRAPKIEKFADRYHKSGAITSAVDLVRGVGVLLGWDRLDHPAVTDYLDNDYAKQAELALSALKTHDLVCIHVEASDEASHEGRLDNKIEALEGIDADIIGPLLDQLPAFGDWRLLIAPDHRTPVRTRAHAHGPVPAAVCGTGIAAGGRSTYDEIAAAASGLSFDPGWKLMERFLKS
jgi:2,3-bisphosphoglycerate-independent phosphoglycerate mutase